MQKVCVLLNYMSVPKKLYVLEAEHVAKVGGMAEDKFRMLIEENAIPRSINEEDVDTGIEDGYFKIPETDYEVFIVWPEKE